MAEDFPRTVDEITHAWLSTVLGRTVTGYETAFLEGGVLSDAFKLYAITYDGEGDDAPFSVVVKLASRVQDLPGLQLHELKGDREGPWAVKVSGNWRVTFVFRGEDVELVDYEDYH